MSWMAPYPAHRSVALPEPGNVLEGQIGNTGIHWHQHINRSMLRCMRTTLTLDPDVAALLQRVRHTQGGSFKTVVNDALREGLRHMIAPPDPPVRYRTPPVDLGRCLLGSLDDVAEVLAAGEGERFR